MKLSITIQIPEDGNFMNAQYDVSILGGKVKNRNTLEVLPGLIKALVIETAHINTGIELPDRIKEGV